MAESAPPRAKKAKKSAYSLFMLNFCNSFHEFNFEMENFLKASDDMESDKS